MVSQYANRKSANLQGKNNVSDPDLRWFASNIFFTYVRIFQTTKLPVTQNCPKSQKSSLNLRADTLILVRISLKSVKKLDPQIANPQLPKIYGPQIAANLKKCKSANLRICDLQTYLRTAHLCILHIYCTIHMHTYTYTHTVHVPSHWISCGFS